ncbi:SERTA domain-containing protein 3 isoform X1 [Solea solea]|uniref:SERTA domain-containing protein 3 isoform X1 n=1 Tax=Solea solea TaxID=90069 RepID=UPI00272D26AF|nr:SERTA domain-containing protein 3 isoform X1 [Solea solea]XP_058490465.1 SERTA domain-containing protein 3 isoform X1 [Solea solea]
MIMKGQKRKFPPEDVEVSDRSSSTWESQRQFVFSVSLNKYQHGQELPEPSLRRSVLIANTLRQINLEACRSVCVDGPIPPCSSLSALQENEQESSWNKVVPAKHHSAEGVINSDSALTTCPVDSSHHPSNSATSRYSASCQLNTCGVPLSVGEEDEDWGSMSTDTDFSLSAAISSILTALDSNIDWSPQAAQRMPLRSLENLQRPSEGNAAWAKQGVRGYGGSWEQQEECRARESNMDATRSSYLSDLTVEDLFQDIDTSLLERDMGVLGLRGNGGGYSGGDDLPRYLLPFSPSSHPLSFSLNQNLKCLPSFSSFSPLSPSVSPSLSSPPSVFFSGQNQGLELEHLMEILVES